MKSYPVVDWVGLYGEGWGEDIVPEAYSHPAKYSRALIRHIYQHLIDSGLVARGQRVIDPFGGVALGALDAQLQGLHWVGCELEPKFVELGNRNLELWRARYAPHFPRWGSAVLLQGDSRKIGEVVRGAESIVSSPPYANSMERPGGIDASKSEYIGGPNSQMNNSDTRYGESNGQLGAMPAGDVNAIISSPPYEHDTISRDQRPDNPTYADRNYGQTEGQLGGMSPGDVNAVIASPPFGEAQSGGGLYKNPTDKMGKMSRGGGYGAEEQGIESGQLGNMSTDDYNAIIASPPFLQTSGGTNVTSSAGPLSDASLVERHSAGNAAAHGYGEADGQMQAMREGDYEAVISSPPFTGVVQHDGGPAHQEGGKLYSDYGSTPGQLANAPEGAFSGVVSSPPYNEITDTGGKEGLKKYGTGLTQGESSFTPYSQSPDNLGNAGDTFWSAALTIVSECYKLLAPGSVAVWVCKDYVRNKRRVPFSDQWRMLCERAGFTTHTEVHAWVVEDNGTQLGMMETEDKHHKTERKSFFRRLAEKKGSPRIDYETVWIMVK